MSKLVNILLIVVIASLALMLVKARQTGADLKKEYGRLSTLYGELPIDDEDKFYVVFKGDLERRKFNWRVYSPALKNGLSTVAYTIDRRSVSHSGTSQRALEQIAFARFRIEDGKPELFYSLAGSSSVLSLSRAMGEFLTTHWDDLNFEVMGAEGAEVVSPGEPLALLVVRIPDSLESALPENLAASERKQYLEGPIFELRMGDSLILEKTR